MSRYLKVIYSACGVAEHGFYGADVSVSEVGVSSYGIRTLTVETILPGGIFAQDTSSKRNFRVCYYRGTSSCTGKGLARSNPDGHIKHVSSGESWELKALRSGRLVHE